SRRPRLARHYGNDDGDRPPAHSAGEKDDQEVSTVPVQLSRSRLQEERSLSTQHSTCSGDKDSKARKQMNYLKLTTLLATIAIGSSAFAAGGGELGNGGGGVFKDGLFMSFYSAGFYTEPKPATDDIDVPGLTALLDAIQKFPHMTKASKMNLV